MAFDLADDMCARRFFNAFHALLTLAVTAVSGSAVASADAQITSERDSGGIHIVENPARLTTPVVFTLGGVPRLDIDGRDGLLDDQFEPNQGYLRAARRTDGSVAVIDVNRVHFFDAQARRTAVTDRSAPGRPPAFLYLTAVCRTHGDTIVVHDGNWQRVAVFDERGRIVRSFPIAGVLGFNFCLDDGTFVGQSREIDTVANTARMRLWRVRTDGSVANTIGTFPIPRSDFVTQRTIAVAAAGQFVYYGDGATSEIRVHRSTGELVRIVRSADSLVRITDEEKEFQLAASIPADVPPMERSKQLQWLRSRPHPATWPAFGRIQVDPTGRLWVQDTRSLRFPPEGWTAFDPDGRIIGRFMVPPPMHGEHMMEVISFGEDDVLVRRYDPDRTAHLTIYPLVRTSTRPPASSSTNDDVQY